MLDVVRGVSEAWDNGDPDAFVAGYLEDASAILPGSCLKSRRDVHGAMAFSFHGPLKGTRSSGKVLDVRFLNDDAAVVISETGILIPGESEAPPERLAYATWVLAKRDGKWLLAPTATAPRSRPASRDHGLSRLRPVPAARHGARLIHRFPANETAAGSVGSSVSSPEISQQSGFVATSMPWPVHGS
jgi:uncharacterized protein (TIGR02246 family)